MRKFFSRQFLISSVLSFLLLMVSFNSIGQPTDPDIDPDIPITGIEILLAAGALFGVKKLLSRRNKSE